jgi:hypothetical protein
VAATIESTVYDVDVANFGAPTDIDGNGKIIVLYTRAVNELTPASAGYVVGGFQYARDLFPKTANVDFDACPTSNVGEMFYMLAADPSGTINGNNRSVTYVIGSSLGVVAHEFQHVINASRRLYVVKAADSWQETVWLNEGLSHIAEELTFYAASGRGPDQNIGLADVQGSAQVNSAFNSYGVSNIDRFDQYLEAAPSFGPFEDDDALEIRGATWSYLRYVADRRNGNDAQFWSALVNTSLLGLANLDAAAGADAMTLSRDWAIANYADDAVPGVASIYTHPSWNFRNLMAHARWGGYGLAVTPLVNGQAVSPTVRAGSAAYFRFGVLEGVTADVRVAAGGTTVPGACANVVLAPGGVFHGTPATASAVCLPGGLTGGEYALVVHYGARDASGPSANGNSAITVVGNGIRAPIAPPTPARFPSAGGANLQRTFGADGDGGFEQRLRAREASELGRLVRGAERKTPARTQMDPAAAGTTINIIRIR